MRTGCRLLALVTIITFSISSVGRCQINQYSLLAQAISTNDTEYKKDRRE